MVTKQSRQISVSLSTMGVHIGFIWFERDESDKLECRQKGVDDIDPQEAEAFRQYLSKLHTENYLASFSSARMSVIYDFPEVLGQVYDLAVQEDNPLSVFLTPYEIIPQPHQEPIHARQS